MYSPYKPTVLDYTKLVSIVYAVSLISFGIIFPIAEALKDQWLETVYHTVFLTFTLTLSSFFLVYLLFFILRKDKPKNKNETITHQNFASRWKSKLGNHKLSENVEAIESTKKDLLSATYTEEPFHAHRYHRRKSAISFHSFSGLEIAKHRDQSAVNLSLASLNKSAKILNMREVEPVNDETRPSHRKHRRSNFSLAQDHSDNLKDISKNKWSGENDEELKSDSENEECDEVQTWINTDSFGNVYTHNGSNLFLRLGALVFGLGNLVNYALEIQANLITNVECSHKMSFGWIFIWMFIFVFLQTYFLFKHAKIKVAKHQPLVWFGMVHLIFTNINLWIHTMVQEIIDEYRYKKLTKIHSENSTSFEKALQDKCDSDLLNEASKYLTPFVFEYSLVAVGSISSFIYYGAIESNSKTGKSNRNILKIFSVSPGELERYVQQMNIDSEKISNSENKRKISNTEENKKQTIIQVRKHEKMNEKTFKQPKSLSKPTLDSNLPTTQTRDPAIYEEKDSLQKSHLGMFAGMVILCITIVTSVVFLFSQLQHNRARAEIIYFSTDIVIHLILFVACIAVFVFTRNLAFAPKPVTIDDILILLATFGSVTYEVINASALFTSLRSSEDYNAGSSNEMSALELLKHNTSVDFTDYSDPQTDLDPFHLIRDKLQLVSACIGIIQTSVQSLLIFISLRRYPATMHEATEMPGRGTIAFLIVGNLSVWIFRTILCKNLLLPAQIDFYGEMGCLLLINIYLPVLLFFRFHSSVCLVDIWKSAYQLLTRNPST